LAEKRVNAGLDKMLEQAPYLTIVERQWTSGWFRSEQEVTFEIFAGWLEALNRKPTPEGEEAAVESDDELESRKQSAVPGTEPEAEQPAVEVPAEAAKPIRFTVRNEILHGPVLWPASLGLARVNSKLVLNEEIRNKLVETFGTDEPMRISSRIGFFGGGSTRFHGYDPEKREVEIGWTFLVRRHWGGPHNGEMKRLLLDHAFRFVDRVIFLIGPDNRRSRRRFRFDFPTDSQVCHGRRAFEDAAGSPDARSMPAGEQGSPRSAHAP
jgi:hypothetical protein